MFHPLVARRLCHSSNLWPPAHELNLGLLQTRHVNRTLPCWKLKAQTGSPSRGKGSLKLGALACQLHQLEPLFYVPPSHRSSHERQTWPLMHHCSHVETDPPHDVPHPRRPAVQSPAFTLFSPFFLTWFHTSRLLTQKEGRWLENQAAHCTQTLDLTVSCILQHMSRPVRAQSVVPRHHQHIQRSTPC